MNKVYLIQFRTSDNAAFESKVKSIGSWIKYFDDNWIVESNLSAKDIYERISVGNEDKNIFVVELDTSNYWGRMNAKLWEYLKPRRKK